MSRSAAVLLLLLASCERQGQPQTAKAPPRKPRITVVQAALREIVASVEAAGSIEASEEVGVPAGVSGILDAVAFKEGDRVGPDTVLAEIEVEKYRLGADRAKAELDRAAAQAELAETLYTNRLKLHEEGRKQDKQWVTEEQMAGWRADQLKAKADADRARADLELARRDHRNARVRAPLPGLINRKFVSKGEFVKAETVLATILNVETLHVRFSVPELEASRLAPGDEVRFTVRSAPGREFKARLFYLNQKADAVTRAVECKAEVLEGGDLLRPGTYAQVRASTGRRESIVVPERAVLPTERGFVVFVVEGAVVRERPVKLGLRLDGEVEIAEGLRPGERIGVEGALTLRDGAEVEIVEPQAP